MRKIAILTLFLIGSLAGFNAFAQTDGLSYQAVIIDNNPLEIPGLDVKGNYLSEGKIGLRFTVYRTDSTIEYQETQQTITDKFGMVSLIIGTGDTTSGIGGPWNRIEWDGTPKKLGVEIQYENADFVEFSKEKLLYIPYAAHRKITASETVIVQGATTLHNTLEVDSAAKLHNTLTVDGTTMLNEKLIVENTSTLNGKLTVDRGSPTLLTGSLDVLGEVNFKGDLNVGGKLRVGDSLLVKGAADLKSSLHVAEALNVDGPVSLTNNLKVDGSSEFNTILVHNLSQLDGDLKVGGASDLSGTLNVNQATTLNSTLSVTNGSATSLSGTLKVDQPTTLNSTLTVANGSATSLTGSLTVDQPTMLKSNLTVNATSELNGQVTIDADVDGDQSDPFSHPLRVKGSTQGIAITLDGNETVNHNFLTFYDGDGEVHGAVEGCTSDEFHSTWQYIASKAIIVVEAVGYVAEAAALAAGVVTIPAGVACAAHGVAIVAALAVEIADEETSIGVRYSSGGADYAEWIEKANPKVDILPGEVVGVKAGKVSYQTDGADHFLVISTNPAVLGNLPSESKKENFEKVAFLGQVPVRVVGKVNEGDYLVPSGNNDGLAIAYSPANLPTTLFSSIIGVAWESGPSELMNVVNVAIGLKTNDLAKKVARLENELDGLKADVARINQMLKGEKPANGSGNAIPEETKTSLAKQNVVSPKNGQSFSPLTRSEFQKYLATYGYLYEDGMKNLREEFAAKKTNYKQYPDMARLIDHPLEAMQAMYDGQFMKTMWPSVEKRMFKGRK